MYYQRLVHSSIPSTPTAAGSDRIHKVTIGDDERGFEMHLHLEFQASSRQVFFFHSPFALLTFLQLDYMHVNCDDDIDNEHIATNTNTLTNGGLETQTRLESQVSSFFFLLY
jgi:hypothetical protein